MEKSPPKTSAKEKVLQASLSVIRSKGYGATTVDDLCAAAGVTKGAFFHHFKSKEDLAVAAAEYWSAMTNQFFENAPYQRIKDPLDRVLGYIDFRKSILQGTVPEFTCLVGTMVQEAFDSNPRIRDACKQSIFGHAADVEKDIELAIALYAPKLKGQAKSLGLHTQAVIQGAFILAKASEDAHVAAESITHLRTYFELLFNRKSKETA